jgi:hypothetical protein
MVRTFAYSISLLLLILSCPSNINGQDTIDFPLKVRIGAEVIGPVKYFSNTDILNLEGFVSVDLNEKRAAVFSAGYLNYEFSQYNYTYLNNGVFVRAGLEFNLLAPEKSQGKYWAGVGISYGLSRFNSETPILKQDNYWGSVSTSIPPSKDWGHFIEFDPGFKAEVFKNFTMGWTVSVRALIHTTTGKDLKPVYFPGYGNGTKSITSGFKYFLVWNIPFRNIKVIIKKPPPEEEEDEGEIQDTQNNNQDNSINSNTMQQNGDMRR